MKVIHVTWLDSQGQADWEMVKNITEKLDLTHTVGFFVCETENSIVIALSYDPATESVHCFKHIPMVAIEEVRTLCQIKTT